MWGLYLLQFQLQIHNQHMYSVTSNQVPNFQLHPVSINSTQVSIPKTKIDNQCQVGQSEDEQKNEVSCFLRFLFQENFHS